MPGFLHRIAFLPMYTVVGLQVYLTLHQKHLTSTKTQSNKCHLCQVLGQICLPSAMFSLCLQVAGVETLAQTSISNGASRTMHLVQNYFPLIWLMWLFDILYFKSHTCK